MPRPPKISEKVRDDVCKALRGGSARRAAAIFAGIGESTFYTWMEKGAKAKTGEFREFREAVTRAEADCEVRNVAIVLKAAGNRKVETVRRTSKDVLVGRGDDKRKLTLVEETVTTHHEIDWRAAAWWLERRNPDDWKRTEGREISGPDGGPVPMAAAQVVVVQMPDNGRGDREPGAVKVDA